MALATMTFGEMPSRELFDRAWDAQQEHHGLRDGRFHFGNDPRLGTCSLSRDELWDELQRALADYNLPEDGPDGSSSCFVADTGDWCSAVLYSLDIEWV